MARSANKEISLAEFRELDQDEILEGPYRTQRDLRFTKRRTGASWFLGRDIGETVIIKLPKPSLGQRIKGALKSKAKQKFWEIRGE